MTNVSFNYSPEVNTAVSSKSGTTVWRSGDDRQRTIRIAPGTTAVVVLDNKGGFKVHTNA